jgi:transposase
MHLSPHSLRQIDDAYLQSLEVEALRGLSMRLLADLKEAWDRLNQGPENSSRPPSSRAPWERKNGGERETDADAEADALAADDDREPEPAANLAEPKSAEPKPAEPKPAEPKPTRKPGKQPGAPGIGRTQVFQANAEQAHYPERCAGCGQPLAPAGAVAYTGFQAVDLRWDEPARPGLTLWVVDHRYREYFIMPRCAIVLVVVESL